jgi:ATP-dependent DNA helicase PIF1
MLIECVDPTYGQCNGTRILIVKMGNRVSEAKINTSDHRGCTAMNPKAALDCDDEEFPFTPSRLQFLIKLAFALKINKRRPQSLEVGGC